MKKAILFLCISFYSLCCSGQIAGTLDTTFNTADIGNGYGDGAVGGNFVNKLWLLHDSKMIIGGDFTGYNGVGTNRNIRLDSNGLNDTSFNPGGSGAYFGTINTIAIRPDGKMFVAGDFTNYNGIALNKLALLNADGTLDTSFNPGIGADSAINAIAYQPDGKLIVAGEFTHYNGTAINRIARLNIDGSLDNTFNINSGANNIIYNLCLQPDGKIIINGTFSYYNISPSRGLTRINADGSIDAAFNANTSMQSFPRVGIFMMQTDGKILIPMSGLIGRLNSDGSIDTGFNATGSGIILGVAIYSIMKQPDDKIILVGKITRNDGIILKGLVRMNPDGTIDNSFTPGFGLYDFDEFYGASCQPDGKILCYGRIRHFNGYAMNGILRLNADGTMDSTFNWGSGANATVQSLNVQPDDKIIVSGSFQKYNGEAAISVARLNADGSKDNTFNSLMQTNATIYATAVQPDGKILIGGIFSKYNNISRQGLARLNTDGSLDTGFNADNHVRVSHISNISVLPNGKIIISGSYIRIYMDSQPSSYAVFRLNPNGTKDTTFNSIHLQGYHYHVIQPDGKIIVTGGNIKRFNSDGSIDNTFTPGTGTNAMINSAVLQSDGKIIIGGDFTNYNGISITKMARLNSDGLLDTSFNAGTATNNGTPAFYDTGIFSIAVQASGKIIVTGNFTSFNGVTNYFITRLNPNGSIDTDFNQISGGSNSVINTVALQSDGKPIIGGSFTQYNGIGRNRIARLNTEALGITTFNEAQLNIYPNPVNTQLTIRLSNKISIEKIIITDLTGKAILTQQQNNDTINVENFAKGIYIIEAFSGNEKFQSKFIKI